MGWMRAGIRGLNPAGGIVSTSVSALGLKPGSVFTSVRVRGLKSGIGGRSSTPVLQVKQKRETWLLHTIGEGGEGVIRHAPTVTIVQT